MYNENSKLFVKIVPEFEQTEEGIALVNRQIVIKESSQDHLGKEYDKLSELQSLVANGSSRSLITHYVSYKVNDFMVSVLLHEEGLFLGEVPFVKYKNGETLTEDELKWLPWNTALPHTHNNAVVFGHVLFVKDDGVRYSYLTFDETEQLLDALKNNKLEQA